VQRHKSDRGQAPIPLSIGACPQIRARALNQRDHLFGLHA
jgi:hypothetical protein